MASPSPSPAPAPVPADDADQLRAIVPPVRFGDWLADNLPLIITLGALALLGLAALAVWLIRRRKRPLPDADPRTPRQRADERLQRLRSRADALDARAFGNEACDILRDLLAAERGLPIARQTSEEFLHDAAQTRAVAPGEHALLADFLATCDGLKFARADASADVKTRLLDQAGDFVTGTAVDRPPPLPVVGVE